MPGSESLMPKMRVPVPAAALLLAALARPLAAAQEEIFEYRVDWRFWHAGDVSLSYQPKLPAAGKGSQAEVTLSTRGFVDKLYNVRNRYRSEHDAEFCAISAVFEVREGKKRRDIQIRYQEPPGKVRYTERDLVRGRIALRKVLSTPPCVHDELAALARFRRMRLEPGDTIELPISNGKKSISARIRAVRREEIKTPSGIHRTIRYEAYLFNNVLYRRSGRLFFWLTDDARRVPVQFQVRLRFYYGTITLRLTREETR